MHIFNVKETSDITMIVVTLYPMIHEAAAVHQLVSAIYGGPEGSN